MSTTRAAVAAVCVAATAAGAGAGPAVGDLPNGDFEQVEGDRPAGWAPHTWSGAGDWDHVSEGRDGSRCVRIDSEDGGDLSWTTIVPVKLHATYRLSGWVRAEGVSTDGRARGALLNIHNIQPVQTPAVVGTSAWTHVQVEFETELNDAIQINCLFGGWGSATGTAWYDDLKLELLSAREFKPSMKIDCTKIGEPISELIYGQFIEHLGRCIYGGIWAEMLEDRKFHYAVGAEESPWAPMGPDGAVTMATANAFVGEHDPVISAPGSVATGVVQEGLALESGRRYEGRVIIGGDPSCAPVLVRVAWGNGDADAHQVTIDGVADGFTTRRFRFRARDDATDGRLEIVARGEGTLRIGTASLMPADNIDGMRRDTLGLLKELDSPIYRWPGGNFVSGYDWRDGVGDRDRRPPRKNPAWQGVEHNDFGIHEFMRFCEELGTEPYIAVNTGLGDIASAVDELTYVIGAEDTEMGRLRARNGRSQPWDVQWWGLGNEMYGGWQLGHMPLEEYTKKSNEFAEAFRGVDPDLKLVAVGAVGVWSEGMLSECAEHMDALSEHFYCQEGPGIVSHVQQIPGAVRRIAQAHRGYRETIPAIQGKDIRIALDEWNYWYGPHAYGELGTRYFLKDALGIAAGLNEFARQSDIFVMANYAQTVNVIGCIKTTKADAAFAATGIVLKAYREHFGKLPVEVTGEVEPLDICAALTEDGRELTVAVVNPLSEAVDVPLDVDGVRLAGKGRVWITTGPDPMAYNEPGGQAPVTLESRRVDGAGERLTVPPLSACIFVLPVVAQ